ncbi:MAG: hypothetical protein LC637_05885 [Xanthomonadaceae bacterium]|nr:hypothetical protein [Xanthomonadaceae bacterium]
MTDSRARMIDVSRLERGSLELDGEGRVGGARLMALVPADKCGVISIDLPEMSAARMHKALRWAAEEAIAGEAENQHVVPLRRRPDGRLDCLVVAIDDLEDWLHKLPTRPQRMVPDAACLPWRDSEVVLMRSGDAILGRFGSLQFDRFEPELLDSILPELVASAGEHPRVVWIGDSPPEQLLRFEPEVRHAGKSAPATLASGALESGINLMVGDYAPSDRNNGARRRRFVAIAAALALVLVLAGQGIEYVRLKQQLAHSDAAVARHFSTLFPDITSLQRPRAQAERALQQLRGGSRDRFVQLVGKASPVFSGAGRLRVESISYAAEQLDLELTTPDLADIEALRAQLEAQGMNAAVRDITVATDGTRARLLISGGRS